MSLYLHVHIYKTAAWSFISVGCLYLAILIICIINFKGSVENCLQTSFSESGGKILLATLITTALYVLDDVCITCMHYVCLLSCLYTPCELYVACIACMHQVHLYAACIRLHSLSSDVLFFHGEQRKLDLVLFFFSLRRAQRWGWTWEAWEVNVIRVHYAKLPKKQ